ncbi:MAG: SYNERG-CTERM sorting domain-containing protein, partial [Synergistaceae bacterium]|nr:SYNERG-CTERM sorting domain-containing protein [Synergistaceae bacterium]
RHLLARGWGDQYDRGYQLFSQPAPLPTAGPVPPEDPVPPDNSSAAGCSGGVSPWGALLLVPLALLPKKP